MSGLTAWWSMQARNRASAPTAMDTLIAALGGNSVVVAAYDDAVNVATSGGRVTTWDDARGTSGFGPQLVGNVGAGANKPAYVAGTGVTTDGVNYLATTSASSVLDVMGAAFWQATIATYGSVGAQTGPQPYIGDVVPTSFASRFLHVGTEGKASITLHDAFTTIPTSGEGPVLKGTSLRLVLGIQTNFQGLFNESNPRVGFEVAGRAKQHIQSSFLGSGSNYLALGIGGNAKQADTFRAHIICSGVLTRAQVLALKTYAATKNYVLEATKPKQLIATGDSLTFGFASTDPTLNSWPAQLMSRNAVAMASYEMYNQAVSFRRVQELKLLNPIDIHPTFGTFHTKDLEVLWIGTNDVTSGFSQANIIADIKTEAAAAKATGATVVLIPVIPRGDAAMDAGKKVILQALQADMQTNGSSYGVDAIVPLWNDSRFNDFTLVTGSFSNATIYNADKLHLTDAGYTAIADLVFTAISGLL